MATRCRSARCAAERRGARRELETWRHKLIACVGFESILEGIYGPRLLQDLSIFEDCEPEVISDWSTEACCPFCNLQLEKLTEHVPVSPPPAETPPPQGLSTSEKLQCQADQFLHAVFRKKEFPEFCDPTIPLAAQELMRKMIRQFAIEYACKSQPESPEGHNTSQTDFTKNPEPDGPLDLTISRVTHCPDVAISAVTHCPQQADGVLDLSKKNTSSSNVQNYETISGSLMPVDEDQCRMEEEKEEAEHWRGTVLEKVLSSLCYHHRVLLYKILQDMREDYNVALALRDAQRLRAKTEPYCCPERKSPSDPLPCSLNNCTGINGCCSCLAACGTCTVTSICICFKTLTCQNLCVGKVICPNSTIDCPLHKILVCQHQRESETVCNTHSKNIPGIQIHHCKHLNSQIAFQSCCSPSPPSLSPVPVDAESKIGDRHISCKGQESLVLNKLPHLLPHKTEGKDGDQAARSDAQHPEGSPSTPLKNAQPETDKAGSFLGDVMDQFTEKLKKIQPVEKEPTSQTNSTACDDTHLTEIITTVLHSSSNTEYNLKKLFEERMASEQRSPQTRSRRRQEVLAAISKSPDLPASRRQSLQIKRDLARLDPSACRRKLGLGSSKCPKNVQSSLPSLSLQQESKSPAKISMVDIYMVDVEPTKESDTRLTHQEGQEKPPADLPESPPRKETDISDFSHRKTSEKSQQDKSETLQPNCKVERSRRNIVPPQRYSSYITEPRKISSAASLSESKRTPNVSTATSDSVEINTSAKTAEPPIKTEAQDHVVLTLKYENITSSKINRTGEDENGERINSKRSPRTECLENSTSPAKRLKVLEESQSSSLNLGHSTDTDSLNDNKNFNLKYVSPIKLMLVSPVKGENGVKYTLKAADSGSSHGQMFDPCIEASWAGNAINEQTLDEDLQTDSVQNTELVDTNTQLPDVVASNDDLNQTNSESLPAICEVTPVKRRPGRPKKLGPQIEKAVKRPIGRPPKAKTVDSDSSSTKNVVDQKASEKSKEEDGNKNLKITIMYGRSRKTRRVVSEDLPPPFINQQTCEVDGSSTSSDTERLNVVGDPPLNVAKNQLEDLKFVMPMEDRKGFVHASSSIKCQKQCEVTRKPGRPPKVKISGISVTVTTVSPRQRKIHMKRDTKESPPRQRALLVEFEPSKDQKTINELANGVLKDSKGTIEEGTEHLRASILPVRHSVRERKPSIHLLHSVATSRSLSRNNALDHRPHKILVNKANDETNNQTNQHSPEPTANTMLSEKTIKVSHMKSVVRFSGASVDSIFASDESLKWWPITASSDTLNEELARRMRLISGTWVSDVLEAKKTAEKKQKPKTSKKSSAVKMLFEKNYSMEKLCSWFMQTTETQSLAIVKKASTKNPYEIFQYNSIRSACRDICPSPQAERLRKHVKKFAKIVPKSPEMYHQAQAMMYCTERSVPKRSLFSTSGINLMHANRKKIFRSCGTWGVYRAALLRARTKFKPRTKKTLINGVQHKNHEKQLVASVEKCLSKEPLTSLNSMQDTSDISECKSLENTTIPAMSNEESIGSKTWSPEKLKECRVFLKKINSPNTKAVTEECIVSRVKINTLPAGRDVLMTPKEQKSKETAKIKKTFSSPRKSPLSKINQTQKSGTKHRSSCTSKLPPAKMTRQSRSNRGVLGSRWSDFVLGPSK